MASWNIPALINKISEDVPALKSLLTALFKWTDADTTDVPVGAKRLESVTNGRQIQEKTASGWASVGKLMHDVDTLDGWHAAQSALANHVVVRDSNGKINGDILGNANTATTASGLAQNFVTPIANGGTGATSAVNARANLGANNGSNINAGVVGAAYGGTGRTDGKVTDVHLTDYSTGAVSVGQLGHAATKNGVSADTLIVPGSYFCTGCTVALHYPSTADCFVRIEGSDEISNDVYLVQHLTEIGTGRKYWRESSDGGASWEDWLENISDNIIASGGAVSRPLSQRFADFVNVKDFGAAGDGVTDDSAAWVAFDTAYQAKGLGIIPPGQYLVNSVVKDYSNGSILSKRIFRDNGYGPLLKPEIIPFTSDLASNTANVAASTKWVKDLSATSIYIDASVASSGDGTSAATAVKTINEAISIAYSTPKSRVNIIIAGGTYNENILLDNCRDAYIGLSGNVTINGYVNLFNFSSLVVYCQNNGDYTLAINCSSDGDSSLVVNDGCGCRIVAKVSIVANSPAHSAISIASGSLCEFDRAATITHSATGYRVIQCYRSSTLLFNGDVTVSSSACSDVFGLWDKSICVCYGHLNADNCNASDCALRTGDNSYFRVDKSCQFKSNGVCVFAYNQSMSVFNSNTFTAFKCTGTSSIVGAWVDSVVYINVYNNTNLYLESYNSTSWACLECGLTSHIHLGGGSGTVNFYGPYSYVVISNNNGRVTIDSSLTVNGNNVTGQRYFIYNNAQVYVEGKGVNRIPGTSGGYVKPNELSFYG